MTERGRGRGRAAWKRSVRSRASGPSYLQKQRANEAHINQQRAALQRSLLWGRACTSLGVSRRWTASPLLPSCRTCPGPISPVCLGHLGSAPWVSACQHFLVLPEKGAQKTLDLYQLWLGCLPWTKEGASSSCRWLSQASPSQSLKGEGSEGGLLCPQAYVSQMD